MIVMKFGGTSVEDAKAIERVAAIVKERVPQQPVVVVSAMARVTDTLLTMARAAGAGERKTALKLCRSLQERHYNTASELLGTALFTDFHSELGADFELLDELLRGISAVGEITPRTTDHVAAFGEILSSKIVAAAFSAKDPRRDLPQMKVKPKNAKVSGLPSPRRLRSTAAKRPNSIRRVCPGRSDSANSPSLSRIASRKRCASPSRSKPTTRSSAERTTIMSP